MVIKITIYPRHPINNHIDGRKIRVVNMSPSISTIPTSAGCWDCQYITIIPSSRGMMVMRGIIPSSPPSHLDVEYR
jgi:hypothetical protein